MKLNATRIEQALRLVAGQMELASSPAARLVVCGGASLIATGVLSRVTKDVDVVALQSGKAACSRWGCQRALRSGWLSGSMDRD